MNLRNGSLASGLVARFRSNGASAVRAWAMGLAALATGCTAHIGSSCAQATDCSAEGDRVCDTAQPGGYCTILDCLGNAGAACPDNAVCVEFQVSVPGCPYDDYESPARTGLSFCMEHCSATYDCREGYVCTDPRNAPWNGAILDNDQSLSVCIAAVPANTGVSSAQDSAFEGGVCSKSLPELPDASPFPSSSSSATSSTDASAMTPVDASGADATGD